MARDGGEVGRVMVWRESSWGWSDETWHGAVAWLGGCR